MPVIPWVVGKFSTVVFKALFCAPPNGENVNNGRVVDILVDIVSWVAFVASSETSTTFTVNWLVKSLCNKSKPDVIPAKTLIWVDSRLRPVEPPPPPPPCDIIVSNWPLILIVSSLISVFLIWIFFK